MTRLSRRTLVAVGAAFFIAGIAIGLSMPRPASVAPAGAAGTDRLRYATAPPAGRNVYAPDILHDGYVVSEQRKIVELLEQQCRTTGKDCALARSTRQALTRNPR